MATVLIAFLINNLKRYRMKEKINGTKDLMKSECLNILSRLKMWTAQTLDKAIDRFGHRLTLATRYVLIFGSGIVIASIIHALI